MPSSPPGLRRALARRALQASDRVADWARDAFRRQFVPQGLFGGTPWPPLERERQAYPSLVATGALKASLTERGAPGGYAYLDGTAVVVGTSLPYAAFASRRGRPIVPEVWPPTSWSASRRSRLTTS